MELFSIKIRCTFQLVSTALLVAKDKIYIRILTYELEDEYVSFRIFSQGKWNIKLS